MKFHCCCSIALLQATTEHLLNYCKGFFRVDPLSKNALPRVLGAINSATCTLLFCAQARDLTNVIPDPEARAVEFV